MALDVESGKILKGPDIGVPQGHISLPGRADLADYYSGFIPASVGEVESAITRVQRDLSPIEARQFGNTACKAFIGETVFNL